MARVEGRYLADGGSALLVAGVVVEFGRPLHPVVLVSLREGDTAVHLWPTVAVERTDTVKRFLAQVARELGGFGAGDVIATNLPELI